jgi:hypothetical protein
MSYVIVHLCRRSKGRKVSAFLPGIVVPRGPAFRTPTLGIGRKLRAGRCPLPGSPRTGDESQPGGPRSTGRDTPRHMTTKFNLDRILCETGSCNPLPVSPGAADLGPVSPDPHWPGETGPRRPRHVPEMDGIARPISGITGKAPHREGASSRRNGVPGSAAATIAPRGRGKCGTLAHPWVSSREHRS